MFIKLYKTQVSYLPELLLMEFGSNKTSMCFFNTKSKNNKFLNSIDPDEVAYIESSHLDLCCLPSNLLVLSKVYVT